MNTQNCNILIAGAGASQGLFGNRLTDPALVPAGLEPHLTFYDPDSEVTLHDNLPHLQAGAREGRVDLVHTLPDEQFDAVIIATASEYHADAAMAILDRQEKTPLFVLEKPVAASYEDLARFREVEARLQPHSIINEPYFVMRSVRNLVEQARSRRPDNPLTEACVWSSKARRTARPHGQLGIYAIELPHLHGAASWIAGQTLSLDTLQENVYYADVQGIEHNDGNYMRFEAGSTIVHIAQGLGKFTMDQYGKMLAHPTPPRTRKICLRFADGSRSLLDIEPAFPSATSGSHARAMTYHSKNGSVRTVATVEDPRKEMIRHILHRIQDPSLPNIPGISLSEALERNQALLDLKSSANVQRGLIIDDAPGSS